MGVFEQAWDLAKMPLVPGSIRYDGPHDVLNNEDILNEPPHNYSAEFHDPVEDRKIPMNARYYPANDNAEAFIRVSLEDEDSWPEEQPRMSSSATAGAWEPYISSSPHGYQRHKNREWSGHIGPVYPQRRGKGTALYDMLAAILNDRVSGKLFPTTAPTTSAKALWRAKTGSLSEARERGWPVPDEPIRWRAIKEDPCKACRNLPDDHPDWMKGMCEDCYDTWVASMNLRQGDPDEQGWREGME